MKQFLSTVYLLFKGLPMVLILVVFVVACSENKFDPSKAQVTTRQIDSLNALISEQKNAAVETLKQADSLFKLSLAMGYEKGIAEAASQKIRLLRKDYQYDIALQFISEILQLPDEFKDSYNQVLVSEEIGLLYYELDDFDQAYHYLTKALAYYEQNKNQKKESYILSRIGLMFSGNDDEKSKEYLFKSLDISLEIKDSSGIARELNNIGLNFMSRNSLDSARYYLTKALLINEKIQKWDYYEKNLANLAQIEKTENNFSGAIELHQKLMLVLDTAKNQKMYVHTLLHFGDLYLKMEFFDAAIPYFSKAIALGEKHHWLDIQMFGNKGLYFCNKNLGNVNEAMSHFEVYTTFKDSLYIRKNFQELALQEFKFKNDQLAQEKLWNQQKQKYILYFLMVLLLVFLILLFQLFRKQKFKVAEEKLERKLLQNELEGKERELTSFVLNMIRLNEKKLEIVEYLKHERPRLKKENHEVIDTAIHKLEYDQDARVWEEFEIRFNQVNSDFYQKLSTRFPDLSNNEKKLCAFLQMNMTTKEISIITRQNPPSIDKARYRLRKKLNLQNPNTSLTSFLSEL